MVIETKFRNLAIENFKDLALNGGEYVELRLLISKQNKMLRINARHKQIV